MAKVVESQNQYGPSFWLLAFAAFLALAASSEQSCSNQTCGSVNVLFPFGLTSDCAFSSQFELQCSHAGTLSLNITTDDITTNGTSGQTPFPVLNILNDSFIIDISAAKSSFDNSTQCFSGKSLQLNWNDPYVFSSENQFGSFGNCSIGILIAAEVTNASTNSSSAYSGIEEEGCGTSCLADGVRSDCVNRICCLNPSYTYTRADSVRFLQYEAESLSGGNCSGFSTPFFNNTFTDLDTKFALKLLWALPSKNGSTNDTNAIRGEANYACSENSDIIPVPQVPGYLCRCEDGYKGDGYSKGNHCTDINECADIETNDCIDPSSCRNTVGSYKCHCKSKFLSGDGRKGGSGCKIPHIFILAGSIVGGLLVAIIAVSLIIYSIIFWKRRRRHRYFLQNGGLQLQQCISQKGRLFGAEELQLATQNFSDQLKLGVGGYGTVFKGTLKDGKVVAIKKANRSGDDDGQFLNEVSILAQINHRHIVRLLGCCLETETPLLVYEFVSNGTLSEHLVAQEAPVGGKEKLPMGWKKRLQIARETAEALAYLHAAAAPPILHRDVKSSNILLDDNLEAKVADFGVSRLVPEGEKHVSTAVQGTIGYLDPEYFQTLQLTDKSDVYSLGVVLVELMTGLKPVDNQNREPRFANLVLLFIDRMTEGRVEELIDQRLVAEEENCDEIHATILKVVHLARRCLALKGAKRPTMRDVAEELWVTEKSLDDVAAVETEEAEPLLWTTKSAHAVAEEEREEGAVVAANAQYYVMSSSTSSGLTVDPLLFGAGTATPR